MSPAIAVAYKRPRGRGQLRGRKIHYRFNDQETLCNWTITDRLPDERQGRVINRYHTTKNPKEVTCLYCKRALGNAS